MRICAHMASILNLMPCRAVIFENTCSPLLTERPVASFHVLSDRLCIVFGEMSPPALGLLSSHAAQPLPCGSPVSALEARLPHSLLAPLTELQLFLPLTKRCPHAECPRARGTAAAQRGGPALSLRNRTGSLTKRKLSRCQDRGCRHRAQRHGARRM